MHDEAEPEPAGREGVPPEVLHEVYEGQAPWDTGRPQPAIVGMLDAGRIRGEVLDLGCGTGENALRIAAAGHSVVGLDLVPRAIELARAKALERDITGVEFIVGDALDLGFASRFDTVLDAAVFHVFSDSDRPRYASSVHRALRPSGKLHVLVFTEHEGGGGPRRVTREELRDTFCGSGWIIRSIVDAHYETLSSTKQAWHATVERAG